MNYKKFLLICFLLFYSIYSYSQTTKKLTSSEKESLSIFNDFKKYITSTIEDDIEISDTVQIKSVLLNYILPESSIDTIDKNHFRENEIPAEKLNHFIKEFKKFHQYFYERKELHVAQHLSALPIRLFPDKCLFNKLSLFQQKNTLVYFDDRYPKKIIGYMLLMPKFKDIAPSPRILSWTLQFEAGYWAFRTVMGTVGIEYFLTEGIKGPKHPIGN